MRIYLLLSLSLLLAACSHTQTAKAPMQSLLAETDDLAMVSDSALQLADQMGADRVLVVFDIDNTLLAMEQGLGSDQWYYWQKALQREDPCSSLLVGNRLQAQGALFFASAMRPTQADAAWQVGRLQAAELPVIALTSRGPDFRLQTFRELRRNDFSFWSSALPPQRGYPENFVPPGAERNTRYEEGVYLTAGQHKGEMLKALLKKTGTAWPAVIVIVDDKADNLQAVMETFAGSGTAVHAWRYSREDRNVAALDTREASDQWSVLRPALMQIEEIFGPDNFDLPAAEIPADCTR